MQFTYWHEVEDTFLLGQVFSEPISIGSIDLFSVEMLRDGPTVRFYLIVCLIDLCLIGESQMWIIIGVGWE